MPTAILAVRPLLASIKFELLNTAVCCRSGQRLELVPVWVCFSLDGHEIDMHENFSWIKKQQVSETIPEHNLRERTNLTQCEELRYSLRHHLQRTPTCQTTKFRMQ